MDFQDLKIECKDCHQDFYFTAGEQHFYQAKGFTNSPARCPACRLNRKLAASPNPIPVVPQPLPALELLTSSPDTSVQEAGTDGTITPISSATLPALKAEARITATAVTATPSPVTLIKCTECQRETSVPFMPQPNRPVYCRECYVQKQGSGSQPKSESINPTSTSVNSGNALIDNIHTATYDKPASTHNNLAISLSTNSGLTLPEPVSLCNTSTIHKDLANPSEIVSVLSDWTPPAMATNQVEAGTDTIAAMSELELVQLFLDHKQPTQLRRKAVIALAQCEPKLSRVAQLGLILALRDESWQISWTAAEILGAVGTPEVGELLDFKLSKYLSQPSTSRSKEDEQLYFILRQAKQAIFKREQTREQERLPASPTLLSTSIPKAGH